MANAKIEPMEIPAITFGDKLTLSLFACDLVSGAFLGEDVGDGKDVVKVIKPVIIGKVTFVHIFCASVL